MRKEISKIEDIDLEVLRSTIKNKLASDTDDYHIVDSFDYRVDENTSAIPLKQLKVNVEKAIEKFGENEFAYVTWGQEVIVKEILEIDNNKVEKIFNDIIEQIEFGLSFIDKQKKIQNKLRSLINNGGTTSIEYDSYSYILSRIRDSIEKVERQIEKMIGTGSFFEIKVNWIISPIREDE